MTCKEFEKRITAFVTNELPDRELKRFLEHMDNCPDCKEEVTIQILVLEGMVRLEDGGAFDLQEEIHKRMEEARRRIRMHGMLKFISLTLAAAAVVAMIFVFIFFR